MRAMRWLPVCAIITSAQAMAADGQNRQPDDIVVLGKGLPLSPGTPAYGSVMIDRDRLDNSASGRIENILTEIAGFQQFRRSDSRSANASAQGATLRALGGNASSRTLVLLDGVPMSDPFFGYIPFSALVPERLSLIRVTRGGGSGAFGAGAVAGTIELASAGRDELPDLTARAFYGSRDSTELSATVSPDIGTGFASLSGRWDRGDGFQTTPRVQRNAATVPASYESWSLNLRAVAPLSASAEVQFRATLFRDDRTLRFRGADSLSEGQDASIRLISRGSWQADALAYAQLRNFSNIVISATTLRKSLDQHKTPSSGFGGKIELRPPVGDNHVLKLGGDVRIASGTMYETAFNAATQAVTARRRAGGDQSTVGLFAEDDWTIGSLILTGAVRADRWTISNGNFQTGNASGSQRSTTNFPARSGWEFSGRAGALIHASDAVDLRVSAYTGFRLPTLNELYRPFVVFPITTQANAALAPEKLRGVEAGVDLKPSPAITLGATLFYNRLNDAIANVTTGINTRQRRNVDAIVAKGIELTANARSGDFSFDASYAFSRSQVRAPGLAFDGLTPAQSPRHAASATLAWSSQAGSSQAGPSLAATLHYVSAQYEDDLQTDRLRHALTLDAVAGLALGHGLTLTVRAENILDATVVTRNAAGSIDLGTPRTLWIGLKFAS
jgi:outer membrane receptor protein involved in Fe transport